MGAHVQASKFLSHQLDLSAGVMVAFTPFWLLLVPLAGPKRSPLSQAAWQRMPPPPPCALLGRVVCPTVLPSWPETAGLGVNDDDTGPLVSNRALREGIPVAVDGVAISHTAEENLADIRICVAKLYAAPMEAVRYWALS